MEVIYPVFHVSVLRKHKPDSSMEQRKPEPKNVDVNREEEWKVEDIVDCQGQHINLRYLVH